MHQPLNTYTNKCNGYCIMMIFREQFKIVIKRVHIISYIHRIPIDYHSIGNICRITNDFMRAFSYQIHTSQARARSLATKPHIAFHQLDGLYSTPVISLVFICVRRLRLSNRSIKYMTYAHRKWMGERNQSNK